MARSQTHTCANVELGMGDDAAVLRAGPRTVVSTDMVVEDVDFRRRWASWRDVGHRAAAVNLSDMAAMGAEPRGLVAALAASPKETVADMVTLLAACHALGMRYGAPLVGGDLSATTGPLVLTVTVLGALRGSGLRRGLGQPGDILGVTGKLGGAGAGLALLEGRLSPAALKGLSARAQAALCARQLRPTPRVQVAQAWAAAGCIRSCADISDGLARDVHHVVGARAYGKLDMAALPIASGVATVAAALSIPASELAIHAGEDFELVVAVAPALWAKAQRLAVAQGVALTAVGSVVAAAPGQSKLARGFDHFRA